MRSHTQDKSATGSMPVVSAVINALFPEKTGEGPSAAGGESAGRAKAERAEGAQREQPQPRTSGGRIANHDGVRYGENLMPGEVEHGRVLELHEGFSCGPVPQEAYAVVRASSLETPAGRVDLIGQDARALDPQFEAVVDEEAPAEGATVRVVQIDEGLIRVEAKSRARRAFERGEAQNATTLVVEYLLDHNLATSEERRILESGHDLHASPKA